MTLPLDQLPDRPMTLYQVMAATGIGGWDVGQELKAMAQKGEAEITTTPDGLTTLFRVRPKTAQAKDREPSFEEIDAKAKQLCHGNGTGNRWHAGDETERNYWRRLAREILFEERTIAHEQLREQLKQSAFPQTVFLRVALKTELVDATWFVRSLLQLPVSDCVSVLDAARWRRANEAGRLQMLLSWLQAEIYAEIDRVQLTVTSTE